MLLLSHFNTSHVNVNLFFGMELSPALLNFNTSHVNVNHTPEMFGAKGDGDFNTSHVNVNRYMQFEYTEKGAIFQYISC